MPLPINNWVLTEENINSASNQDIVNFAKNNGLFFANAVDVYGYPESRYTWDELTDDSQTPDDDTIDEFREYLKEYMVQLNTKYKDEQRRKLPMPRGGKRKTRKSGKKLRRSTRKNRRTSKRSSRRR